MRRDLITKAWSADEEIEKAPVKLGFIDDKQEIMAADDRTVQLSRESAVTADFRIDFGNEKFPRLADLLCFRFDE